MVDNTLCCYHMYHHHHPLKGLVWNDSKTKGLVWDFWNLKDLCWDFWNLKDHFGKNEKLKGPLDTFELFLTRKDYTICSPNPFWPLKNIINMIWVFFLYHESIDFRWHPIEAWTKVVFFFWKEYVNIISKSI